MRAVNACGWVVLGLVAVTVEGYAAFWFFDYPGPFFSRTGLLCVLVSAVTDIAVLIIAALKHDELHASFISSQHSRIGQALRSGSIPETPLTARSAWDGEWEDPEASADKMRSDR